MRSETEKPGWTWGRCRKRGKWGNTASAPYVIQPSPGPTAKQEAVCNITKRSDPCLSEANGRLSSQIYLSGTRFSELPSLHPESESRRHRCPVPVVALPWVPGCSTVWPFVSLGQVSPGQKGNLWESDLVLSFVPLFYGSNNSLLGSVSVFSFSLCRSHGCQGHPEPKIPGYRDRKTSVSELFSESESWCHVLVPTEAEPSPKAAALLLWYKPLHRKRHL